ncbi:hypothetical protein [Okeania sp. SIO2B3]|uniref:hypothetical protein n=1 Tax=Okeania sp. SIO2B3 TaxID=2607784 RepID=UPI0013C1A7C9|nr:hypothetical protein [Okeania sp. SIO2B3]NET46127.1 hypothetical protein [Okeania sp. SIO2B3]
MASTLLKPYFKRNKASLGMSFTVGTINAVNIVKNVMNRGYGYVLCVLLMG